ncbi:ubiquinol-cytochrome c reductase iron-sulfur subunit [Rhodococcus sp. X156]|uniref:cytochrome bc1 complex Rieske iron-sulfur subunit n=1 Tax=Rhodococcus sp. X156 TaxID=2499145 RepID=UPI000FD94AD1|nr:ubiquinol-cytochrome c reductase iron-sulfur subunit [Rhodococcus sp. X156]
MSGGDNQGKPQPTDEELAGMSRDELVTLGLAEDDVVLAHRRDRWPVKGTKAEKRAERSVASWFALSGIAALAFVAVYLFWPWEYAPAGSDKNTLYTLYTPMLGLTMGIAILALGVGVIAYAKKFVPDETAIQQRHLGGSSELDKKTTVALLQDSTDTIGIGRRSLIKRSLGFGAGALGIMAIMPLGGLVKNPWKGGSEAALWTSGWTPKDGETIYLRRSTGHSEDVSLVRAGDLDAGSMETVFPFRESERGDEEALLHALRGSDNPVMLIRLRPEDAAKVVKRKGQETYNYGDYYAYSKICTHLGCPTSLYEQQNNLILCPCHQSQFDVLEYAKPIFGPAARALPQLPITVNSEGYLVANGNFNEAVGPAFWERKS